MARSLLERLERLEQQKRRLIAQWLLENAVVEDVRTRCAVCGAKLATGPRYMQPHRRFCSDVCRKKAWRARHRDDAALHVDDAVSERQTTPAVAHAEGAEGAA